MTGPFELPVGDIFVSSDWQDHRRRNPPSTEPGTDYASGYGTPVRAPFDGIVNAIKTTNTGAMGRHVFLGPLTDGGGSWIRLLHLSSINVRVGQRVRRGDVIARSGASAWGSDWGVGPHVHTSCWPNRGSRTPTPGATMTSDFERFTGQPAPEPEPEEDDEMARNTGVVTQRASDGWWLYLIFNYGSGVSHEFNSGGPTPVAGGYNNRLAAAFDTPSWAQVSESHYNAIKRSLQVPVLVSQAGGATALQSGQVDDLEDGPA